MIVSATFVVFTLDFMLLKGFNNESPKKWDCSNRISGLVVHLV